MGKNRSATDSGIAINRKHTIINWYSGQEAKTANYEESCRKRIYNSCITSTEIAMHKRLLKGFYPKNQQKAQSGPPVFNKETSKLKPTPKAEKALF
ncbi:hypothetical protein [Marinilabilia salmonicolor]|uniref:hypothetical protein n=1 Tax=Marinilabilia salmonicolor TaxID=989 RepID=UPI00029A132B|nr:hypothetical protein [Marinilabilia salmonicolor]